MVIRSAQYPSFKSYIPVTYYATNPETGKYSRVVKEENIKKCQRFIISNLNGTAKRFKDDLFVEFYKKFDSDYVKNPVAKSFYDEDKARVFLITGKDADEIQKFAKPIGIARGEAMDKIGSSKSYEASLASRIYFHDVRSYLKNTARQIRANDGTRLEMRAFFDPTYTKKGKHTGFKFVGFQMVADKKPN